MPLTCQHKIIEDTSHVKWSGIIDESWDTKIEEMTEHLEKKVVFHFDELKSINSIGIRKWIQFLNYCRLSIGSEYGILDQEEPHK